MAHYVEVEIVDAFRVRRVRRRGPIPYGQLARAERIARRFCHWFNDRRRPWYGYLAARFSTVYVPE